MTYERWSDKELTALATLMQDTNDQVREINGSVKRHDEEIFGRKNSPGLKKEVSEIHDFMVSTKASVRTLIVLVSAIGIVNIIAIINLTRSI